MKKSNIAKKQKVKLRDKKNLKDNDRQTIEDMYTVLYIHIYTKPESLKKSKTMEQNSYLKL